MASRQTGFTLLEVLVALVLMALFTVTSYRALNAVLEAGRYATGEMQRWRILSGALSRLGSDLGNAVPPYAIGGKGLLGFVSVRDESGATGFTLDRQVPADEGGQLLRVGYRYADGKLDRLLWQTDMDVPKPPDETRLLDGIGRLTFRYLDAQSAWQAVWPTQSGTLPRAVEVQLTLDSGESLRRVYKLL